MGFYAQTVFPFLNDKLMSDPQLVALKREVLAHARGRVLEIGIGSGLNLALYPAGVESLIGVDPSPGMHRRAHPRAQTAKFPVELHQVGAEKLPFDDASFDTVVSTMVLCTVGEPVEALTEARRVLKPGGRYLFLEHGQHEDPKVLAWQRRLNPLQRVLGCGCELDRDIRSMFERAGFTITALRMHQAEGVPKTHGFVYMGEARSA